jgi:O-6-methylguanine DNA methyltransferase
MPLEFSATTVQTAYLGHAFPTPLGLVRLAYSEKGLAVVKNGGSRDEFVGFLKRQGFSEVIDDPNKTAAAADQLCEYLEGRRTVFELPVDWERLRPFQRQVLQATYSIPYGATETYASIAQKIDRPRAARAVGRAEATNPMPLIVPCHRVLGSDGKLHGYGGLGGLKTKAWLLELEKQQP